MREPTPFRFQGDLDIETAPYVMEQVFRHAQRHPGHSLTFDCQNLHFLDSTGLSALERFERVTGRRVILRNLPPACRRVLEITHLDQMFVIEDGDAPVDLAEGNDARGD
jgi:anti-anti-sigma factor